MLSTSLQKVHWVRHFKALSDNNKNVLNLDYIRITELMLLFLIAVVYVEFLLTKTLLFDTKLRKLDF